MKKSISIILEEFDQDKKGEIEVYTDKIIKVFYQEIEAMKTPIILEFLQKEVKKMEAK